MAKNCFFVATISSQISYSSYKIPLNQFV